MATPPEPARLLELPEPPPLLELREVELGRVRMWPTRLATAAAAFAGAALAHLVF